MSVTGSRLQYTCVQPNLNVPVSVTGSSLKYTAVQPNLNGPAVPGDLMPVRVDVLAEGVADREPLLSQNGVGCGTLASLRFPHHHQPHLPERGQFSAVQVKMIYMRSERPICALPRLFDVFPTLPSKQLQCSSDWRWTSLVLSRKVDERFRFPRVSPPGDRWCDILGFVPAGSVPSSSVLKISKTQATYYGCFAHQSSCSVISLHSGLSRAVHS